jgi:hypothetical protein
MMRRRRAMVMVAAIFMGAAIRPRPPDVKVQLSFRGACEARDPGISSYNLWILRCAIAHRSSMLRIAPE